MTFHVALEIEDSYCSYWFTIIFYEPIPVTFSSLHKSGSCLKFVESE